MSVWNPDNIKDVAESIGVAALSDEVVQNLSRDVEYRLSQVLDEAVKCMRHGQRTTMTTQDISQALRILDVEPLYGYESTRPLRFGEASLGPGQPLFYVEDEEVDFEKLINAPLPKVPREISFTAHWLAVEGVQPSIPQNPTTADARGQELAPRGPGANVSLAALGGEADGVAVKPMVKHILSKELQLFFEKICSAVLNTDQDPDLCSAALSSVRNDPGLHQLVPYFVQFIAEKVTHNLKHIFILSQMMRLAVAMLENTSLYCDPYVRLPINPFFPPRPPILISMIWLLTTVANQIASLIPPILTCLIGRRLGDLTTTTTNSTASTQPHAHYALRALAASLITTISQKYATTSQTLRPRLARTCLKHFLDPTKPLGVHYGAIAGLAAVSGPEGVRVLIIPNLKAYDAVLVRELGRNSHTNSNNTTTGAAAGPAVGDDQDTVMGASGVGFDTTQGATAKKTTDVDEVVGVIIQSIALLLSDKPVPSPAATAAVVNDEVNGLDDGTLKDQLVDAVGAVVGERIYALGRRDLCTVTVEEATRSRSRSRKV
ncbi:MAG: hypothetical protein M1825_005902 [Sarcosagium campestre]|nr:MAG: hypothetical protein M1825_005902 [Sarcosagium campestre]